MNEYFLILTFVGLAAFGMVWMPAVSKLALLGLRVPNNNMPRRFATEIVTQ